MTGSERRADAAKRRYAERRGAGLCVRCGLRAAASGHVRCAECMDIERPRSSASKKSLKRSRTASGLCRDCGGVPVPGRRQCAACLERNAARKARLIAEGTCTLCGRNPASPGMRTCAACGELFRRKAADCREIGLCVICGRKAVMPGRTRCRDCAMKRSVVAARLAGDTAEASA